MEPLREKQTLNDYIIRVIMNKKLILPAELRVCATCSYWDGERAVDPELAVVVVEEDCSGKCLAEDKIRPGLNNEFARRDDCLWEHLVLDAQEGERASHEDENTG
jgi:hypothetical protein